LSANPGAAAVAGVHFTTPTHGAAGPVYETVASTGGYIYRQSFVGQLLGTTPDYTDFVQSLSGLNAGTYVLEEQEEDINAPTTPGYLITIIPDYA
jgi:hypothetical protein